MPASVNCKIDFCCAHTESHCMLPPLHAHALANGGAATTPGLVRSKKKNAYQGSNLNIFVPVSRNRPDGSEATPLQPGNESTSNLPRRQDARQDTNCSENCNAYVIVPPSLLRRAGPGSKPSTPRRQSRMCMVSSRGTSAGSLGSAAIISPRGIIAA